MIVMFMMRVFNWLLNLLPILSSFLSVLMLSIPVKKAKAFNHPEIVCLCHGHCYVLATTMCSVLEKWFYLLPICLHNFLNIDSLYGIYQQTTLPTPNSCWGWIGTMTIFKVSHSSRPATSCPKCAPCPLLCTGVAFPMSGSQWSHCLSSQAKGYCLLLRIICYNICEQLSLCDTLYYIQTKPYLIPQYRYFSIF